MCFKSWQAGLKCIHVWQLISFSCLHVNTHHLKIWCLILCAMLLCLLQGLTLTCMCFSVSVVFVSSLIRLPWAWRAPQWAAASCAGRRARGSGSDCGSSSKTRCSTPSQLARWGGTESPAPAPKLPWLLTSFSLRSFWFSILLASGEVTFSLFHFSCTQHCVWLTKGFSVLSLQLLWVLRTCLLAAYLHESWWRPVDLCVYCSG